ncbi:hypothetical protein [Haliangium sp.]|uniref:hypothetical protein n=1 Tax=Haliangium sp. TaxID=2663208 RepID=UPI003D0E29CB
MKANAGAVIELGTYRAEASDAAQDQAYRRGIEEGWRLAMSHAALRLVHLGSSEGAPEALLAAVRVLLGVRDDEGCLAMDKELALEAIRTGQAPYPIRLTDELRDDMDAFVARYGSPSEPSE